MSSDNSQKGRPKNVPEVGRKSHTRFDIERKRKFLKKLETCGSLSEAAASVGISRHTVYKTMDKDERFKERVEIARERSVARLEKEMEERIYNGNEKIEYDGQGNVIKKTVTKDNALLTRALEANAPEKYGKKSTEDKPSVQINIGDSAIHKLAEFLKIDIDDDTQVVGADNDERDAIEAEWEEYEEDEDERGN